MNKGKDILICIIILMGTILLGIGIGYGMYLLAGPIEKENIPLEDPNENNSYYADLVKDSHYEEGKDYLIIKDEKKNDLVFYGISSDKKQYSKISIYECNDLNCSYNNYYDNSKVILIKDKKNNQEILSLYNYEKGVIFTTDDINNIGYVGRKEGGKYFTVRNDQGKVGLITLDGKMIVDYLYDNIGLYKESYMGISETSFSFASDTIVFENDNKYGLLKLSTGEVLLDNIYENIGLIYAFDENEDFHVNSEYYKIYSNGKWYLYSFFNNKSINGMGYDDIILVDKGIMVVKENNRKISFKSLKGENLFTDIIDIYRDNGELGEEYDGKIKYTKPDYYAYFKDDSTLVIKVYDYYNEMKEHGYEFNLN